MLQFADLHFFTVLGQHRSLAAAARALNLTPSAVTQRLQAIAARVGLRLMHRTSRGVALTEAGEYLRAQGGDLNLRLDRLNDSLASRHNAMEGSLRIVATLGFGRRYVAPLVRSFYADNPRVHVALTLSDRPLLQAVGSFDVAIFIGSLRDSSMIAYPVARNQRMLVASPAYLRSRGTPTHPHELERHRCIALRENDEDVTLWQFSRGSERVSIRVRPHLSSNDGEVARDWAIAGEGLVIRSHWDIAAALASRELVPVLAGFRLPAADVVALSPQGQALPRRARAFIDHVRDSFKPQPPWLRE